MHLQINTTRTNKGETSRRGGGFRLNRRGESALVARSTEEGASGCQVEPALSSCSWNTWGRVWAGRWRLTSCFPLSEPLMLIWLGGGNRTCAFGAFFGGEKPRKNLERVFKGLG